MGQYHFVAMQQKLENKIRAYDKSITTKDGKNYFTTMKLTETSWFENNALGSLCSLLCETPQKVAWVGDYAMQVEKAPNKLTKTTIKKLYEATWGENAEYEKLEFLPINTKYMLLVNWDKKQYIKMWEFFEKNVETKKDAWNFGWCLHPLPLLTAVSNGLGGGDYSGTNENKIGCWAWDTLSFEHVEKQKELDYNDFKNVMFDFKEN